MCVPTITSWPIRWISCGWVCLVDLACSRDQSRHIKSDLRWNVRTKPDAYELFREAPTVANGKNKLCGESGSVMKPWCR